MKKQGSAAPLLFHSLTHRTGRFAWRIAMIWERALLNPRALRFLGFNKIAQLIVLQALGVMGKSSRNGRSFQFSIRGLLAYVVVLAVSLGLLRFAATTTSPVSGPIAGILGLLLLGATLGAPIGLALKGPDGALSGATIGAGMLIAALFVVGVIVCLVSVH